MDVLPNALAALSSYAQFIIYVVRPSASRPGKLDKIPVDPLTLRPINPHVPSAWLSSDAAILTASLLDKQYGVGYVLTADDPFWFLDIDNCLDSVTNTWTPLAQELCAHFAGAYIEVSASGKGLHIVGTGNISLEYTSKDTCSPRVDIEFYTQKRFITLTGTGAMGDAGKDCSALLPHVLTTYFTKRVTTGAAPADWTEAPCDAWDGPVDDDALLQRALRSKPAGAIFGDKLAFRDLWEADADAIARVYPSQNSGTAYDESSADIVLAMALAFWTGNDCERIKRLMLQSKLVRDKWERDDYLHGTILKACAATQNWYKETKTEIPALPPETDLTIRPVDRVGSTFLTFEEQKALFTGCVYVRDLHRVLIPGGELLRPDQFKAEYGGYVFPLDSANQKTTRNAWDAFTESQIFKAPRVATTCFKPQLPPGSIIEEEGRLMANMWWPVKTKREPGSITPFLIHLNKLFPVVEDQEIILSYLAACVQYQGIKFQWAPVVQGVEGNGKSLLIRCAEAAIGKAYTVYPRADQISKHFNGWMYGKILVGINDIFVPDSQRETMEIMKPMITEDRQPIERKGIDSATLEVCCNFIINTNHKDGLRKTSNDRRFAPFFTPQQDKADLKRDGMDGDYFNNLFNWLRDGGYAYVSEYLHTFQIPEHLNPANRNTAPITSSTADAIKHGVGRIEQEIEEAIETGELGFRGGWISSKFLNDFLEKNKSSRMVAPNKRRDLLRGIGYDWHEALRDGRVNNAVYPDGVKSRLFIKNGHSDAALTCASEVAAAYNKAQMG